MVLIANINRPPHALASADSVTIAGGVSITPAPGWTMADRGPNWVALSNPNSSAQLQVAVKPASGADLVGMLQADINQLTGTPAAGLINVKDLSAPITRTVQGANFQQETFMNYTADVLGPQGPIPVIGTFNELLNTSTRQTAFVNFRQDDSATTQVDNDGGAMINSML
ncbi:hypothetical protein AWC05_21270 [Mycobacterium florentinum]|uniref:Uncharacterized protein n=1 Tax=Mycobacterium florentinum TaxID=292462 RepID=A0A1X1U7M3_MYCFL|nr:hypothetical protein AWC05_21270 [Mycobacterium florentinum]